MLDGIEISIVKGRTFKITVLALMKGPFFSYKVWMDSSSWETTK